MAGTRRLDVTVGCCDVEDRLDKVVVRGAGKGDFDANIAIAEKIDNA